MIEQLTDHRLTNDLDYRVLRDRWQALSHAFDDALLGDRPGSLELLAARIGVIQDKMRERAVELGVIAL